MKISIEEDSRYPVSPHVIIQCQKETEEVKDIVQRLQQGEPKLLGTIGKKEYVIPPQEVLYGESVDGATYLYTKEEVYRTTYTLTELEEQYEDMGYMRCSKSIVLNIHAIEILKSEFGNRIDAELSNGEHVIISRRYAKELRAMRKEYDTKELNQQLEQYKKNQKGKGRFDEQGN